MCNMLFLLLLVFLFLILVMLHCIVKFLRITGLVWMCLLLFVSVMLRQFISIRLGRVVL